MHDSIEATFPPIELVGARVSHPPEKTNDGKSYRVWAHLNFEVYVVQKTLDARGVPNIVKGDKLFVRGRREPGSLSSLIVVHASTVGLLL